ncbi:MAG: hypothetical protein JO125_17030 [Chloroflexi bacterium]|nr:hypothetical protein [Ktedonobacteraceae bacterium]MBV8822503.1 hypothetical protein [Ktedonobacteraceae bacterium]MBV9021952.1 hypothetical protein [Ktedonobacteraceae bacterium]MBV9709099.1 hypothetical protein [Chloroflexota bacterium]
MFDPRDPYERYYWHYESRRPLTIAQIIALGSVDTETAALVWLILEQGASLTVAGPTDPQPGVGKTTTLNALLQFLPEDSALAYMSGMYENFAFMRIPDINPATTYALCNEVSDHLPIYMWGRVARRYLALPSQGYHIATSVHADTVDDVINMYRHDLRLKAEDVRLLGLIINIGLVGDIYPPRRRWLTTHFIRPQADPEDPYTIVTLPLSLWNQFDDTFLHADSTILDELATLVGMTTQQFHTALKQRADCLQELSQGRGVGPQEMREAISDLRSRS